MSKYFALQLKRVLRYLPGLLLVMILLLGGLVAVPKLMAQQDATGENNQKLHIALCGDTQDEFLQMALSAVSTMDSSRFTLDILLMEEAAAEKALSARTISAYVVFPEGFMETAMAGELIPLKLVSTTGASDLVSIFKEELTVAIGDLLASSENGVIGLWEILHEAGIPTGSHMDRLSFEFVDHIVVRDQIYRVEELGIADSLSLWEYLTCGLSVLFLLLCCLPFAPLLIRQDPALGKLLQAKGYRCAAQTLCDLGAYALTLLVIGCIFLPIPAVLSSASLRPSSIFRCIPVILMVATYSFLLFTLVDDIISGVLTQFFLSLALCFVSGCIYPVFFFPVGIQKLAFYLPTGLARTQLAGCFTGESTATAALALLGYSIVFTCLSIWVQDRKIRGVSK